MDKLQQLAALQDHNNISLAHSLVNYKCNIALTLVNNILPLKISSSEKTLWAMNKLRSYTIDDIAYTCVC